MVSRDLTAAARGVRRGCERATARGRGKQEAARSRRRMDAEVEKANATGIDRRGRGERRGEVRRRELGKWRP